MMRMMAMNRYKGLTVLSFFVLSSFITLEFKHDRSSGKRRPYMRLWVLIRLNRCSATEGGGVQIRGFLGGFGTAKVGLSGNM